MPLYAGVAETDITPPLGIQISGDIGHLRLINEIRDPLYARALVLQCNGAKAAIISLDIGVAGTDRAYAIRDAAAARLGVERSAITLHCTQNHSAPGLGHCVTDRDTPYFPPEHKWLGYGDDGYYPLVAARIAEAVDHADRALQPVTVGAASGIEARMAFNRRFVMRDGSAVTHPANCDPRIRYREGPIDPEVGVVCFRNRQGEAIAALLHYTCHPTHGYPHPYVTADWPGVWAQGVKTLLGPSAVPLVINGCCGNIHHHDHLDPNFVSDQARMGNVLTATTARVLERIEYQDVESFSATSRCVPVPWREMDPVALDEARALVAAYPEPKWTNDEHTQVDWAWVYAVSLLDVEDQTKRNSTLNYEVQVVRIGDIAIVALPGEPFVEGQLQIKLNSPTYPTYLAHMSNHYAGYIPTAEAMARGGYETRTANWSKLGPGALDRIVAGAGELLRDSFKRET